MALINVRVAKITEEARGVKSFLLEKRGLFKLPPYDPGAHIDVHCGEGIIRQYSLCGDPDDRRHFTIAVKQVEPSRGGSDLMHLALSEGDNLEIGAPRNNFPLDESASHVVLLAAGIGITPIISMADRLHQFDRSFELHSFSRGLEFTAFRDRMSSGKYCNQVSFHEGMDTSTTFNQLQTILRTSRPNSQVYMCGPGPFMEVAEALALKNWPSEAVKLERFSTNPALHSAPTSPFQAELVRSGMTLDVGANETILEVLERNNIPAAFSCEQGVCGTCVTEIISGTPDHRDSFLTEKQRAAGNKMCICVSRGKGNKITLNL